MRHLMLFGTLLLPMIQATATVLPVYSGCGSIIRGVPEGIIDYPGGNRGYPHNQNCIWMITLRENERIILSFDRFSINGKGKDGLIIKNGETGTTIGDFDSNHRGPLGGKMPPHIESEGNTIYLRFYCDRGGTGKGFKLNWKRIINEVTVTGGDQCMTNGTEDSVLLLQMEASEMAVVNTIQESDVAVKDAMAVMIQELKTELQGMKMKQETTQLKLDFITELLMGSGCWSVMAGAAHPEGFSESRECILFTCMNGKWVQDGPDPACYDEYSTESPIPTDGNSMVSAEPPFIQTKSPAIPTKSPAIPTKSPAIPTKSPAIPTEPVVILTDPPIISTTEAPEDSGSDCDYSTTFSSTHTMNLPVKTECGKFKKAGVSEEDITVILKKHNDLRAKVANGLETSQPGATNMLELQWNIELAEVAQAWAEQCNMGHDKYDNRKICSQNYYVGQNIAYYWGYDASSYWDGAIQAWYDEVEDMPSPPTSLINSFYSYQGAVIGHYTQVVWAGTYEVGCGAIHYEDDYGDTTYPQSKIYVCNYGPAGNFLNQPIYDIGTDAATICPNGASSAYPGLCATPIPS